jgi:hypothetical protein
MPPGQGMGMPFFVNDPRHWRERAKEARELAVALTDPDKKQAMLEIAQAYERMAERAHEPQLPDTPD